MIYEPQRRVGKAFGCGRVSHATGAVLPAHRQVFGTGRHDKNKEMSRMRCGRQFILPTLVDLVVMEPQSKFGPIPFIKKIMVKTTPSSVGVRNLYHGTP